MLLFFFFVSTFVFASPLTHIVVFGDSSSDDGNLFKLSSGMIPLFPPYYNGRFSNGPTWAEELGKHYYDTANVSYKIYSYGGATARSFVPVSELTLESEVKTYLADPLSPYRENVLFTIWIGINDYLNDDDSDAEKLTTDVISAISASVSVLVNNGAKSFMLLNIPDLSKSQLTHQASKKL